LNDNFGAMQSFLSHTHLRLYSSSPWSGYRNRSGMVTVTCR
jgi:hypothetical protein